MQSTQQKNQQIRKPSGIERRLKDRTYPTALLIAASNGGVEMPKIITRKKRPDEFEAYLMENMKGDLEFITKTGNIEKIRNMHLLNKEGLDTRIREITDGNVA